MFRLLCKTGYVDELGDELGYLICAQKLVHGDKWVTMTNLQCITTQIWGTVVTLEDTETRQGVIIDGKLYDIQSLMSKEDMDNFLIQTDLSEDCFKQHQMGYFLESTGLVVYDNEDSFSKFLQQIY